MYADALLTTQLSNPAILDMNGQIVAFMEAGAYDFSVSDLNDVVLYTREGVEDYGATQIGNLGVSFTQGSSLVTSGYTVLPTDTLVTVNSTGGPNPCVIQLPNVTTHPLPLTIKNMGTVALSVVPFSVQTIDGVNSAFTVPAASGGTKPSLFMVGDLISSWWILASHGL